METTILGIIAIALLINTFYRERQHNAQVKGLINAIIAKNAQEKAQLDSIVEPRVTQNTQDLMPTDNLNDDEWEKMIGREV